MLTPTITSHFFLEADSFIYLEMILSHLPFF